MIASIGYAVNRTFEPCPTDLVVRDGEVVDLGGIAVRCIATPGHANGLVVYEVVLNEERLWFCGDLVIVGPTCETVELGWAGGPDFDRQTYLDSLQRLIRLQCDTLLLGHGPPGIGLGKRLVERAYTKAMVEWR